jgi:small nuclear ribonucleoprotein
MLIRVQRQSKSARTEFYFGIFLELVFLSQDMAVKVLDESVGKIVLIKLKGGKTIRGNLQGFDQHMNLLVDQSEEILEEGKTNSLGTIVVRGDNVVIISPPRSVS